VDGPFVTAFDRGRPFLAAGTVVLLAASTLVGARPATGELRVRGELTGAAVDNRDDRWSAGTITVGTQPIVVPSHLLIELPGTTLTLQEIFALAPARCRTQGATGLLATDGCRLPPGEARAKRPWSPRDDRTPRSTLDAAPSAELPATLAQVTTTAGSDGEAIATAIALTRGDRAVAGAVTFVNEAQGYLRIGGAFGVDRDGALVRINDPDTRQSAQSGVGCGGEGNCSPDARFRADAAHYSVRFAAGYPACVPGALGDVCAAASRPVRGVVDAALLLPIRLGDHVTAQGAFEVVDGVRIFSAHSLVDETSPLARGR
jgi:hypothetical protein